MDVFNLENIKIEVGAASTRNWCVPKDLFYFDGHFPHNPVLPAVAILDISVELIQKAYPQKWGPLLSAPSAKFSQLLRPESKVDIHVRFEKDGEWTVEWKDSETLDVAAHLRIVLCAL